MQPRHLSHIAVAAAVAVLVAAVGTFIGCSSRGGLGTRHAGVSGSGTPIPSSDSAFDSSLAYSRAVEEWELLPAATRDALPGAQGGAATGSVTGSIWTPIGPSPIVEAGCCVSPQIVFEANGRVNSLAVDPTDANRLYLGSAGGGVWRSGDGGLTWTPLTDQEVSLGIGSSHAIAIDPNDPATIYAGTTNFCLLAQSQPRPVDLAQSRGILKSTDGGDSWVVLGSGVPTGNDGNALSVFSTTDINTIIIDPADSQTLHVAAGRSVPGGLFRSTDGGRNWTAGTGGAGFADSLALDTSSPPASRVLYAGMNGAGVRKSVNGGQSWTTVFDSATPAVVAAGASTFHKVIVALAPTATPSNPAGQVVYVNVYVGAFGFIFESQDGGATWSRRNGTVTSSSPAFAVLEGSHFSDMVVDPASPGDGVNDVIYWGGLSQFVSMDSGNTFTEIGQVKGAHGDHQAFLVVPQANAPSIVYMGDDGGIFKSTDQGGSWTGTSLNLSLPTLNAGGLQTATIYELAVKPDATASVTIGGSQDSGMLRTTGGLLWTGTSNDGIDVAFDRGNPAIVYSVQNGSDGNRVLKSTNSGESWPTDITGTIPAGERLLFRNRLAVDPNHGGYLYVGGSDGSVFLTRDGGNSYVTLGQPVRGQYVSSLDVAPSNSDHLVIATNELVGAPSAVPNRVFVSTNALQSTPVFQDITRDLPSRFLTRVAFDPNDANVVYATAAGFGQTTPTRPGHVFRTTITGTAWTDISPLVDIPVNALVLDGATSPPEIYIGTDLGVLRSTNGGSSWAVVDDLHLPNAAVSDLALNPTAGVLRAATWGRGVFELAVPAGPVIDVARRPLAFGEACAGSGEDLTIEVSSVGTQPLTITAVHRLSGSSGFQVLPSPALPLTLAPGARATFTVHYVPTAPETPESAVIRISSSDPGAPHVDLVATGSMETTPPVISAFDATPSLLWPPNHQMVPVALSVAVTDNCDAGVAASCRVISVASSEAPDAPGSGQAMPDWAITGNLSVSLRAERSGGGGGRTYTITVQCTDTAGNRATRATTVLVPLEMP